MKNIIRLPLDQFAYLETEFTGTSDEAIKEYRRLVQVFKAPPEAQNTTSIQSLPRKEWIVLLDRYLTDGTIDLNEYNNCSPEQQKIIQEVKLSMKRIQSRLE